MEKERCSFCRSQYAKLLTVDNEYSNGDFFELNFYPKGKMLAIDDTCLSKGASLFIKYCPMCGRKLWGAAMENDKSRKNKPKSKNYIDELLTKYGRRKDPKSGKSSLENW